MPRKTTENVENAERKPRAYSPRHVVAVDGMRPGTTADLGRMVTDFAVLSMSDESGDTKEIANFLASALRLLKALPGAK